MPRPTHRALALTLLTLMCLAVPSGATAEDEEKHDFGVLFGAGFGDKELVGEESDTDPNFLLGGRYGYLFTDRLGLTADVLGVHYQGDPGFGDIDEVSARLAMDWFFVRTERTRWFLTPGIGWVRFEPDIGSSEDAGFASLELGQAVRLGDRRAELRWGVRADQTVTGIGPDDDDFLNYKLVFGLAGRFGGPAPDDDADGVSNGKDRCPDTPRRAWVDEKGCPRDADGDGVYDGIDQCPDTPHGWQVDATGCPLDADGDGVPDGRDACPATPRGARVDSRGCPNDSDGDGVPDGTDRCPDTPRGARVDSNGCPKDSDGDGVFDGIDRCPDTPRGAKVDASGCPTESKAAPIFTPEKKTLVLEGVNFAYNSAELTPDSRSALDRVAASLKDWPDVRAEVGGHTDSTGGDAYNQKLSARRAEAVRSYLQSRGVSASQLTAKGYGESKPVADNGTDEGRARNRRVELVEVE